MASFASLSAGILVALAPQERPINTVEFAARIEEGLMAPLYGAMRYQVVEQDFAWDGSLEDVIRLYLSQLERSHGGEEVPVEWRAYAEEHARFMYDSNLLERRVGRTCSYAVIKDVCEVRAELQPSGDPPGVVTESAWYLSRFDPSERTVVIGVTRTKDDETATYYDVQRTLREEQDVERTDPTGVMKYTRRFLRDVYKATLEWPDSWECSESEQGLQGIWLLNEPGKFPPFYLFQGLVLGKLTVLIDRKTKGLLQACLSNVEGDLVELIEVHYANSESAGMLPLKIERITYYPDGGLRSRETFDGEVDKEPSITPRERLIPPGSRVSDHRQSPPVVYVEQNIAVSESTIASLSAAAGKDETPERTESSAAYIPGESPRRIPLWVITAGIAAAAAFAAVVLIRKKG